MSNEWRKSFESFISDMGFRPGPDYSIERVDVNGNYCKDNCAWVPMQSQARNKRNNVMLTVGDKTLCVAEWARISGVKAATILARINRGWSHENATQPRKCQAPPL